MEGIPFKAPFYFLLKRVKLISYLYLLGLNRNLAFTNKFAK
ncbi:hypothetical protein L21TH_0371 [Caldisalinibacter kiritimatiensis]|uniref:Uncharacterized protein n=1 Tax=Caldisalinibacter kiritimatiensis TaxID=1304284 RepID=R1AWL2_9FIRM|nr:hypothetical protein L21TH_0371 [Caldisalinibacter kiritimatiensis]